MIHENGVTYNVYGDPQGMERPWELDPVPQVIGAAEWARLEAALAQRARLLDALLADVYGPQRLLVEGLLPPELVFAHPGFLRPCHGLEVPAGRYLHVYAADLGRAPDGGWQVLADRSQSPAGSGYALENRQVLSSILPEVMRDCRVQRLASYFAALRQTLHGMATRHRDNPRIVLMTPGPYNATYFEHAFLARYLGYTLVEGGDLTVRDQCVYLKTLAGLQPVDVILRRLDDAFCDPLELNPGSLLGCAGLVQAARAGNVAVVNTLGSGWLESPALMPFLPALCRRLLDEELALPSAPTWWCGDAGGLGYVLDHLEELVLMPLYAGGGRDVIRGDRLSRDERRDLADRMRLRPYAYAAQENLSLSSLPVWSDAGVQARQTVLRAYAVAAATSYKVMPGGLTRVSASDGPAALSMQSDSGSKDTWVLCEGEPDTLSLLPPPGQPIALRRSGYDFPSRAADNLFWIGRHSERAEGLARLLRSLLVRLDDESGLRTSAAFPVLFRALSAWGFNHLTVPAHTPDDLAVRAQALWTALFDAGAPQSARSVLGTLHRAAASVRDYLTLESWRIITHLNEDFDAPAPAGARRGAGGRRPGFDRPDPYQAGGVQRPHGRKHDSRPGVAFPGPRATPRARRAYHRPAAQHPGRGGRAGGGGARGAAGDRRQLDHLPVALPRGAAVRAGGGPAAHGRHQSARRPVPADAARRTRRRAAARSQRDVAQSGAEAGDGHAHPPPPGRGQRALPGRPQRPPRQPGDGAGGIAVRFPGIVRHHHAPLPEPRRADAAPVPGEPLRAPCATACDIPPPTPTPTPCRCATTSSTCARGSAATRRAPSTSCWCFRRPRWSVAPWITSATR